MQHSAAARRRRTGESNYLLFSVMRTRDASNDYKHGSNRACACHIHCSDWMNAQEARVRGSAASCEVCSFCQVISGRGARPSRPAGIAGGEPARNWNWFRIGNKRLPAVPGFHTQCHEQPSRSPPRSAHTYATAARKRYVHLYAGAHG